jgi:hypothetical protein
MTVRLPLHEPFSLELQVCVSCLIGEKGELRLYPNLRWREQSLLQHALIYQKVDS